MARAVLGKPDDARSPYQVRMVVCESCGRAQQEARGMSIAIEDEVAARAQCDAQRIDATERATQEIPPATRRMVVARQHGRCGVPGCRNATFTEVHHVTPRSEGGTHDPDNLVVLCSAHHAALHRGSLRIAGSWSKGLRFLHADGTTYGGASDVGRAGVLGDVHQALRGLGFSAREARERVDRIRPQPGADASVEAALRLALHAAQHASST